MYHFDFILYTFNLNLPNAVKSNVFKHLASFVSVTVDRSTYFFLTNLPIKELIEIGYIHFNTLLPEKDKDIICQ